MVNRNAHLISPQIASSICIRNVILNFMGDHVRARIYARSDVMLRITYYYYIFICCEGLHVYAEQTGHISPILKWLGCVWGALYPHPFSPPPPFANPTTDIARPARTFDTSLAPPPSLLAVLPMAWFWRWKAFKDDLSRAFEHRPGTRRFLWTDCRAGIPNTAYR